MRLRLSVWVSVALLCLCLPAHVWSDPVAPCKEAVFHLLSPTTGYLTCDRGLKVITTAKASIFDAAAQAADVTAAAQEVEADVVFTAPRSGMQSSSAALKVALQERHSYVLRIRSADLSIRGLAGPLSPPADGWDNLFVSFSTKGKATFSPFGDESNRLFRLASDVALLPCGSGKQVPLLIEKRGGTEVSHDATMQPLSLVSPGGSDLPTARCLPVRSDGAGPIFDPTRAGGAVIALMRGGFQQEKVTLKLSGVYDIFNQLVSIPDKPVPVGTVPADKDASAYYLKASHEAGPGKKPAYSFDIKLAPIFDHPFWGDFEPTVSATVDVGFGKTDSTNTITLGGGLTRLYLTGRDDVTALRLTTLLNIEADKTFSEKHNIVAQPELRFYLPFLNHSRAREARGLYVSAWEAASSADREDLDPDDFTATWGFSGQVSIAGEVGRALGEPQVETDDKMSSVTVPRHDIARILPKASATVEYSRISLGFSATPRYLFATEKVGEINSVADANGQQVEHAQLVDVQGWQVHIETTLTIGIDRSGHIAFSIAYKRGPAAPEFTKVNTFQSGLTIKY